MRPSLRFFCLIILVTAADLGMYAHSFSRRAEQEKILPALQTATSQLFLTDLCVATEARYTRHPAVTDHLVPFMDHPGAIEHFPSGSFWNVSRPSPSGGIPR